MFREDMLKGRFVHLCDGTALGENDDYNKVEEHMIDWIFDHWNNARLNEHRIVDKSVDMTVSRVEIDDHAKYAHLAYGGNRYLYVNISGHVYRYYDKDTWISRWPNDEYRGIRVS